MIRINLLPVRAKKKRNTSLYQLMGMAAAVLVTIIAGVGVHLYYVGQLKDQETKIEEQQIEIKRLEKIIGEVKELEVQKARLLSQLGVIEKLEKGKRGPVRVLDEMSNGIPKRVWITSFKEQSGSLTLEGSAIENADISEFMRSLQKSIYFTDIQLKFTQSDVRDSVAIYIFRIECKVNYAA
jgi:type IV pilus assembly protein PilN